MAISDWRMVKQQRVANSEWRVVFWRAVLMHCRKFSAHQEMSPPEFSAKWIWRL